MKRGLFTSTWLPPFWAAVTVGYSLVVGYRTALLGVRPGLPTAAGISAVTAVWLEIIDRRRGTRLTGAAVSIVIGFTLLSNSFLAAKAYQSNQAAALGRTAVSLIFAYLLIRKFFEPCVDRAQRGARNRT